MEDRHQKGYARMEQSDVKHLGGWIENGDPHTYMPDIWGYICTKFFLMSVLDVGCGVGENLKWFMDYRKGKILGVEGDPVAINKSNIKNHMVQHDYNNGPFVPKGYYDLGLCTEFAEHVHEKYEDNWLQTLTKCRYVLFSHATPGQDGYHHVNLKPSDYWIGKMEKFGLRHLDKETTILRQTNQWIKSPWCRDNIMFFKNENI